jgi:ABC-type multidrug transport system ATPase subunit
MVTQPSQTEAARTGALLTVTGLRKSYRHRSVLHDVSLTAWPGQVVAITGENGSGKTTLMRICAGFESPGGGTVHRAAAIGYCPQEPALFDLLTPAEHITLFAAGRKGAAGRNGTAAEGRELLASLGIPPGTRELVRDLSGGARQKLSLALALLGQPPLLLLDEPYQGFDQGSYLDFWAHAQTWREQGRAVVIVTHLLTELYRADQVIELRKPELAGRPG